MLVWPSSPAYPAQPPEYPPVPDQAGADAVGDQDEERAAVSRDRAGLDFGHCQKNGVVFQKNRQAEHLPKAGGDRQMMEQLKVRGVRITPSR